LLSPPAPRRTVDVPKVEDVDPARRVERQRQLAARMAAIELEKSEGKKGETKKEFDAVAEFSKLTSSRSGGVYIPPT
jgi:pre-mRNA-splicing factor CWC22